MTKPALAVSTEAGRMYRHPSTGELVPSVTTIIAGGVPNPALERWGPRFAAKMSIEHWDALHSLPTSQREETIRAFPQDYRDKAANLGDRVHEAVEGWCKSDGVETLDASINPFMIQFAVFLDAYSPVWRHNEVTVWNRTVGYAGTLDWIADINGIPTLGDTKTGKNVWPEVALQLCALRNAEFILTPEGEELPMPVIGQSAVLHLRPRSWALLPVAHSDENWWAFKAAMEVYGWRMQHAHKALGPRLRGVTNPA